METSELEKSIDWEALRRVVIDPLQEGTLYHAFPISKLRNILEHGIVGTKAAKERGISLKRVWAAGHDDVRLSRIASPKQKTLRDDRYCYPEIERGLCQSAVAILDRSLPVKALSPKITLERSDEVKIDYVPPESIKGIALINDADLMIVKKTQQGRIGQKATPEEVKRALETTVQFIFDTARQLGEPTVPIYGTDGKLLFP